MTLADKIAANRKRWARYHAAGRRLRAIQLRIYDYQDAGKEDKAQRIMDRLVAIRKPINDALSRNRKKHIGGK